MSGRTSRCIEGHSIFGPRTLTCRSVRRAGDIVNASPIATIEILYATDFCESSQRAFSCAKEIARRRGVFLRSIHVIDLAGQEIRQQTSFQAAYNAAHRSLRTLRRELRLGGIRGGATVIPRGPCDEASR